jgi:hypothetical protein
MHQEAVLILLMMLTDNQRQAPLYNHYAFKQPIPEAARVRIEG